MPSFDITSDVDWQEVDNAVNQSLKELATRFENLEVANREVSRFGILRRLGRFNRRDQIRRLLPGHGPRDVGLAGRPNGIKPSPALLPAECLQIGGMNSLPQVVTEYRDVDVFRKPGDQAKRLGQGGSALEQQARAAGGQSVEEGVQRPAHPEVLLHVLHGRP